jgi:hypothetical protein
MLKITLFLAYKFSPLKKMNKQGGITRSTKNKATACRLREQIIFREAMAQIDREAKLAAIGSYVLDLFADDLWNLS